MGADAVGSPGTTQAVIVAKNIRAMKNVRLLFMVFFLYFEMFMRRPTGLFQKQA